MGDQVIVLTPDSTNKIYSRWHRSCTIAEVCAPNSYIIDMGDGSRRHIHANKIRAFVARSQMISIIREDDKEFGEIKHDPTDVIIDKSPSERIKPFEPRLAAGVIRNSR